MVPWVLLDRAAMPGGGELRLAQRGAEFSIMLGNNELMNSRLSGSEEALAKISCGMIRDRAKPRILIGGLGMGFTLRAALGELGNEASVTVAELSSAVVAWARGPMAELFDGCLDDARVTIRQTDVGELIHAPAGAYDAIMLDVDNGPEGLTRHANDTLYNLAGLSAARAALSPGGVFALWSARPHRQFAERLRQTGFKVDEIRVRASRNGRGARHVIWTAVNDGTRP